jgi:hypothetical protein
VGTVFDLKSASEHHDVIRKSARERCAGLERPEGAAFIVAHLRGDQDF